MCLCLYVLLYSYEIVCVRVCESVCLFLYLYHSRLYVCFLICTCVYALESNYISGRHQPFKDYRLRINITVFTTKNHSLNCLVLAFDSPPSIKREKLYLNVYYGYCDVSSAYCYTRYMGDFLLSFLHQITGTVCPMPLDFSSYVIHFRVRRSPPHTVLYLLIS